MIFLHIIRSLRRESGGPAEGLRRIVEGYLRDGHTAEIATLDPPGESATDLPVPVHALGRHVHGYGRSPGLRPWLRSNAGRFDGIVVHGLWQYHGFAALAEFAGRHGYAVFVHGMLDPWFNREYPLKRLKKLPYWLFVERRLLRHAQRVLFTSKVEKELAPTSFPLSRWTPQVVPYGTAGSPGSEESDRTTLMAKLPELLGRPYLLYAGRIHEKKGCDLLLRAYAAVSREQALPLLVMAGPDETGLTPTLQALAETEGIADRVLWPGMLTGAAKWGAFRCAEAFVLPSHQENFGIAVAEALSCGTPVLISDQVNIHGDVMACRAGYVEPDTITGTEALLRRWAQTNDAERAGMRERSRSCWQQHFNSAGTSRAIADVFG